MGLLKGLPGIIDNAGFFDEIIHAQGREKFSCPIGRQNAGAIFIGEYSSEPLGDYFAGPNHILPTKKAAHFTGGLNVHKYLKIMTYQEPTSVEACLKISEYASRLSRVEGMEGHARACDWRLQKFAPEKKDWGFHVYRHPDYK